MKGNYNYIAPFYDRLSKIIFGDSIVNTQKFLVDAIETNTSVLIVGGGTGWILEKISGKHREGLHITYVDISKKMIGLSQKRNFGTNKVLFVNEPIQNVALLQKFQVVITPFVLDNFSAGTVDLVFDKIHQCLLPGGLWLFADFQLSTRYTLWQKPLLKTMYFFFKIICGIEADRLPDTNALFRRKGYRIVSSRTSFKDFICSCIYQKPKAL